MKTIAAGSAGGVTSHRRSRKPATCFRVLVLIWAGQVGAASAQDVTSFFVPGGRTYNVTSGPDGNVWFTETAFEASGHNIGRCTPSGIVTEFPIPNTGTAGFITSGPDGNLWFTEYNDNRVARITPDGAVTEFPVPTPASLPQGIVTGPDGKLWFTEQNGNKVAKMTTQGIVTGEYPIPSPVANAEYITVGSDGNLWFTEQGTNKVGRLTTAGVFTEFPIPAENSIPHGIVSGPDGNLWFVEGQSNNIGRITTSGQITEFPIPDGNLSFDIAAGPDGNLWFVTNLPSIGRITTSGVVTMFPAATSWGIAAGPDGNLWFGEPGDYKIGRMTTGPCTANATTLCLSNSRFRIVASWRDPSQGDNGQAMAVPISGNSGYLWFFDPGNVEVAVKLLNGCSVDGHYWFFAGGLTNTEVTMTVTDLQGGQIANYASPAGPAFQAIQDTRSFSACP